MVRGLDYPRHIADSQKFHKSYIIKHLKAIDYLGMPISVKLPYNSPRSSALSQHLPLVCRVGFPSS